MFQCFMVSVRYITDLIETARIEKLHIYSNMRLGTAKTEYHTGEKVIHGFSEELEQ